MKKYNFILWEKNFCIQNEKDLSILLSLFSDKSNISNLIHWNILMKINSDLENIFVSYKWLLLCLKYLNEKNTFLLLLKIWDILLNLINNSQELSELLSRIPEDLNKMRLLKILRLKWLKKIIIDAKDLGFIIQWLFWKTEKDFLELLWKQTIRNIFLSTNEIIMILNFVDHKDYLINIIGLKNVQNKIKTSKNLLTMFSWLSINKSKKLLQSFTKKEILNFFKNEDDFYNFLIRLDKKKEKIFLNYLNT